MDKINYKDTLNMPKTDFGMKADLVTKEPLYRKRWLETHLYKKVLEKNKNNEKFILHDGPPYANGELHIGHAFNKILKDIVVRYKSMLGFYSPYTPGWDTHGLPIENKILEVLKMSKDDIDKLSLRKKAAKYALNQVALQKEQFKTFQLLSDLDDDYITLRPTYEANQLRLFKKMALDGLIYKGLRPVYWSPSSQSALAEAEVEYAEHRSPSILVSFDFLKGNKIVSKGDSLVIYTTTPWTLIANAAVAVGENIEYSLIKTINGNYVVASLLLKSFEEKTKLNYEVIKTFKGSELLGTTYKHPINKNVECPVILGHHVTTEDGTGLVHIAPLFGEDDYLLGKEYNLKMIMHMNDDGTLNSKASEWEGMFYETSNKEIGMKLDSEKKLLSLKFLLHSYPHDWRTNKPVVYRGTPQWFISIEKIKDKILSELHKVISTPKWGVERLTKMIAQRNDWTISRQRTWGVPIPIFYDENKKPVMQTDIFDHIIELVEKNGTNIWVEKSADELLPQIYKGKGWTKEEDIMDVWFDSGSSFLAVQPGGATSPFDLYFEGSDQYRGWFNSSLINSVAYRGVAPYKAFVSHGFVLDGKGNKMSKSKGNVISPSEIIDKNGADILRLWVSNTEFTSDVTISNEIIKQNIEIYRRIRNTFKFMLGNLFDFKEEIELDGIHALINERLNNLIFKVNKFYETYDFQKVVKEVNKFLIDLSGFYFGFTKDALYANKADNNQRRQIQTNIYRITNKLARLLAPILPTTAEEIWDHLGNVESIHLQKMPNVKFEKETLEKKWEEFFVLKDQVYKIIEDSIKKQIIKRAPEARVIIKEGSEFIKSLDLKNLLMVAKYEWGEETKVELLKDSIKCQRCWNHFLEKEIKNGICQRCNEVINA